MGYGVQKWNARALLGWPGKENCAYSGERREYSIIRISRTPPFEGLSQVDVRTNESLVRTPSCVGWIHHQYLP